MTPAERVAWLRSRGFDRRFYDHEPGAIQGQMALPMTGVVARPPRRRRGKRRASC